MAPTALTRSAATVDPDRVLTRTEDLTTVGARTDPRTVERPDLVVGAGKILAPDAAPQIQVAADTVGTVTATGDRDVLARSASSTCDPSTPCAPPVSWSRGRCSSGSA